ncbi:hypothetical protein [Parvularcula maris]|uniref:PEP-CTERM sorting domain-containing protein n=1 Tax=Parvularcula maris TaxID=2965077 RepID=A0A9X2L8L9_9PROT|nr:hypothetical protein [Parvularcula maris]MCQ8185108.1 hypothetical protein [Parvularcula maris]
MFKSLLCAAAAFFGCANAATLVTVDDASSQSGKRLVRIEGLNVNGELFDATFFGAVSCLVAYDQCDELSDLPFDNEADARAAAAAIGAALVGTPFDRFPADVDNCFGTINCGLQIPFALPTPTFTVEFVAFGNSVNEGTDSVYGPLVFSVIQANSILTWVQFAPSSSVSDGTTVPIPAAALLFAPALLALRRRG